MSSVTLMDILDARDRRAQRQQQLLAAYGCPLLSFTMNIPGPVKNSPLIRRGFAVGMARLQAALDEAGMVPLSQEMLDEPTVGQFADFLNISQSNATYKVNSLIKKGYIIKENSDIDRREYHLKLSEKYYHYSGLMKSYVDTVMDRMQQRFTPEELETFSKMLGVMSEELMPENNL